MKWLRVLLYSVGLILLWRLFRRISWTEFWDCLHNVSLIHCFVSVICVWFSLTFKALKFHAVSRLPQWNQSLMIFSHSNFFGHVTPMRLGELSRIRLLQDFGLTSWQSTLILIQDRLFDVLVLGLGFTLLFAKVEIVIPLYILTLICHARASMGQFVWWKAYVYSWISYLGLAASFAVLAMGFSLDFSWLKLILVVFAATLTAWLPLSWQGLGTKEQVYLSLLEGPAVEVLLALSLTHFVLLFLATTSYLLAGILIYPLKGKAYPPS